MTDFDEVFKKIMEYKRGNIKDVKTKEDLIQFLKDMDRRDTLDRTMHKSLTRQNKNLISVLVDTREAEKYYDSTDAAIVKEFSRSMKSRTADEATTAKTVKQPTTENYKLWRKNPGALDLKGIDTKTHTLIQRESRARIARAKAKGLTVKGTLANPYSVEKRNRRRSLLTGRFIKAF